MRLQFGKKVPPDEFLGNLLTSPLIRSLAGIVNEPSCLWDFLSTEQFDLLISAGSELITWLSVGKGEWTVHECWDNCLTVLFRRLQSCDRLSFWMSPVTVTRWTLITITWDVLACSWRDVEVELVRVPIPIYVSTNYIRSLLLEIRSVTRSVLSASSSSKTWLESGDLV